MPSVEPDLLVCWRDPSGTDLAAAISADLRRRGFRVAPDPAVEGDQPDEARLSAIDQAPDFVLVLGPGDLDALAGSAGRMRRELARALALDRNIVLVGASGAHVSTRDPFPPGLEGLARSQTFAFDPARPKESLALLSHRLASDAALDERRVMRGAKRIVVAASLAIVAILAIDAAPRVARRFARGPETRPLPPMSVSWSVFGERPDGAGWIPFDPSAADAPRPGDRIRIAFSPGADGAAYVFARDARGGLAVLFPTVSIRGASRVRAGDRYDAPVESDWYGIGEAAPLDAVYLFASYDSIENLEELVEEGDGHTSAEARLEQLEATVSGLLDGRRGSVSGRVLTRLRRPIVADLGYRPGPESFSVTFSTGKIASRRASVQPGLLSALALIRFGPARVR